MKILSCLVIALGLTGITASPLGAAEDTTPPTLRATHTWIEKESGFFRFNLHLDPQDDQGIKRLEIREKINATSIPHDMLWREAVQNGISYTGVPWKPN